MPWDISSYSTTPNNNTAINGINIAEGCPASGINDAIRQMMADIATAYGNGQFVPVGMIAPFPVAAPPGGWLLCNGQAVSRTTYAALFASINTTFGSGDGSTTFNLPDISGRVIAGYDAGNAKGRLTKSTTQGADASAVGNVGGEQAHTTLVTEMPSHAHTDAGHAHTATDTGHIHTISGIGGNNSFSNGTNTVDWNTGANPEVRGTDTGFASITVATSTANIQNTGGGTAHNNVQPTIIMAYHIKT